MPHMGILSRLSLSASLARSAWQSTVPIQATGPVISRDQAWKLAAKRRPSCPVCR